MVFPKTCCWICLPLLLLTCQTLISNGEEQPLKLLHTLQLPIDVIDGRAPVAKFSQDGKLLAVALMNDIFLFDAASGEPLWSAFTGDINMRARVPGEPNFAFGIKSLGFTPQAKGIFSLTEDVGILGLDLKSRRFVEGLSTGRHVSSIDLSPQGDVYAVCSYDSERLQDGRAPVLLVLFDARTGQILRQAELEEKDTQGCTVQFDPADGSRLALNGAYSGMKIINADDLSVAKSLEGTFETRFSFSPDGKRIARYAFARISVQDIDGDELPGFTENDALPGEYLFCKCIAYAPDGKLLAFGGGQGVTEKLANGASVVTASHFSISLLEVENKAHQVALFQNKDWRDVESLSFSPDGTKLVSCCMNENLVRVWDVSARVGPPVQPIPGGRAKTPDKTPPSRRPAVQKDPSPPAASNPARQWTSIDGKFKITAEYVQQNATHVQLKKADGTLTTVPKNKLSSADQAYLDRLAPEPKAK